MRAEPAASIRYFRLPVTGVDAMRARTARAFTRHTHDQYGIGLVDAGGHSSWSGRGQVEAGPGTFISVNPGEVHDGAPIGGRPRAWRILYFETDALAALHDDVHEGGAGEFTFAAPAFADGSLHAAFETALSCGTSGAGAALGAQEAPGTAGDSSRACEEAVLAFVAKLGVHSCAGRAPRAVPAPAVQRSQARIDADPAAAISLHELAAESGVSRYQLIRGFQRAVGLSPHAYIMQRRLAVARRLLRAGRAPGDVAALAGFYDQSHLGRCFIRQFGVAPGRYALSS